MTEKVKKIDMQYAPDDFRAVGLGLLAIAQAIEEATEVFKKLGVAITNLQEKTDDEFV